jgi:hypothetical protein
MPENCWTALPAAQVKRQRESSVGLPRRGSGTRRVGCNSSEPEARLGEAFRGQVRPALLFEDPAVEFGLPEGFELHPLGYMLREAGDGEFQTDPPQQPNGCTQRLLERSQRLVERSQWLVERSQ